jgi:hypothetical protein
MVSNVNRFLSNLTTTSFALRRAFPDPVLDAIEAAIRDAENRHGGEIQFAIECSLDCWKLVRGITARDESIQAFSELQVWDTERNSGVLIYVLLAERDIEIVADRGYAGHISEADWREICVLMENAFASGDFLDGSVAGVKAVSELIAQHMPRDPDDVDERPNRPVIL